MNICSVRVIELDCASAALKLTNRATDLPFDLAHGSDGRNKE